MDHGVDLQRRYKYRCVPFYARGFFSGYCFHVAERKVGGMVCEADRGFICDLGVFLRRFYQTALCVGYFRRNAGLPVGRNTGLWQIL